MSFHNEKEGHENKDGLVQTKEARRKLSTGDNAHQALGSSVGDEEGEEGCLQCGLIARIPTLGRLTWEFWESKANLGGMARACIAQ